MTKVETTNLGHLKDEHCASIYLAHDYTLINVDEVRVMETLGHC